MILLCCCLYCAVALLLQEAARDLCAPASVVWCYPLLSRSITDSTMTRRWPTSKCGQIDLLGVQYGADVAVALSFARPELVRRLVLVGAAERSSTAKQPR